MQRIGAVLIGGAIILATAQPAQAQAYTAGIYAGGGVSLPMGDYGDYAKTGWIAVGGLLFNLTPNIWIQGEGMFGSNNHSDIDGDKTELVGGSGAIGFSFGSNDAKMIPYVVGGVGVLSHKYKPATGDSESESATMFFGGAGLYFPMGSYGFFVEGRYVTRDGTNFVPIMVGAQINLGRK